MRYSNRIGSAMLLTLLGPERFLVAQALQQYIAKYNSDTTLMGDFNLTRLDGARVTPDELTRSVQAMGFLTEQRVVVVEGLLSRFGAGKGGDDEAPPKEQPRGRGRNDPSLAEQFATVLGAVPDSTVLIIVERGAVAKNNTLLKTAAKHGKVEEFQSPKGSTLDRWVAERAKGAGVRITPGAQSAMSAAMPDLQTLANEIDKLALYVGTGGTLDEGVLREMSFVSRQDTVFEMTSAVARRDTRGALQQLHRLVEGGTSPEGILPVLAWQVRTLIQVRDMLDRRVSERQMAEQSGMSDYVVRKSAGQAREFTMKKLLSIHARLLELDHGVKTGRADAEMTLDALVVEMCM